ncbi:MAG TPA: hypothetical protein VM098_00245 [Phycisphaerae bacterium]|nr:hypothetical protein [Phycisphaerae bacterium]
MSLRLPALLMVPMLCACLMADTPSTAPASPAPAARPRTPDLARDAVDPYNPAAERARFFQAAGVDNELTEQEFNDSRGKPNAFVRKFDTWEAMLKYDKDSSRRIDWFEADAYRRGLRKAVLAAFDKDRNSSLAGDERDAANRALGSGELQRLLGQKGAPVGAADPRWVAPAATPDGGQDKQPTQYQPDYTKLRKQFDADGDGQLSREESGNMYRHVRDQQRKWEVENYDTDGDGKLSSEERRAMWQSRSRAMRQQWEQSRKKTVEKFDTDGDGKLNGEERTAWMNDMRRSYEKSNWDRYKKYDADGDGQLSDSERSAMNNDYRRQAEKRSWDYYKKWDADGDGKLSDSERQTMREEYRQRGEQRRKEMMEKYDSDGDGKLSNQERKTMFDDYRRQAEQRRKGTIDKYDTDGDGKLSDEERKKMGEDRPRGTWSIAPVQSGGATVVIPGGAGQGSAPVIIVGGQGAVVTGGAGE